MAINAANSVVGNRVHGYWAITLGAGIWGLFWIPLRHLSHFGIEGLWAVSVTLIIPLVLALPFLARRIWQGFDWSYALLGIFIGMSVVLYFGGVLFSDVVRVIFLFYMLPIWATILGRLVNGEAIGVRKTLAILLALVGLYLLLGNGQLAGIPIPTNIGDWFGLCSGFMWACSLVIIRHNAHVDPVLSTTAPFVFGAPFAIIGAVLMTHFAPEIGSALPNSDQLLSGLGFAGLFGIVILAPSIYGQVWGARLVPSTTAALLTMTELMTATISAYLLIGTALGPVALTGGGLIICAAILDLTATENPAASVVA